MGLFLGKVVSTTDPQGGGRIKVRINRDDKNVSDENLHYAFPLLPKMLNVKPKVGETAIILTRGEDSRTQRFYVGPVISQLQRINKDWDAISSSTMLDGGRGNALPNISRFADANGTYADDDETYLSGRKNADVVIGDNDIRIRCGVKVMEPESPNIADIVKYNRRNPSYIKLNYYETPVKMGDKEVNSSANVISDYINLISTNGTPYFNSLNDGSNKEISDATLAEILEKAHPLPYGDDLNEFLKLFVNAFINHTHNYNNLPPVFDNYVKKLLKATNNIDNLLSKNIRIN